MTKTVYYSAKPGSLATMYVTPAARFTIERIMKPGTLASDTPSSWVHFYNVKGQKVWECNEQFFEAHFIKVTAPDSKKKKRATRGRQKHTPGPWKWVVNPKSHSVELSRGSYGDIVMSFERWGMGGATPMFNVNGVLERAADISEPEDGRMHHADWWRVINHPDANLIAAAPEMLEALEAVLFQNERGICSDCTARWPECECDLGEWWRKSMAAVRKAKGEKP